MMATFAVPLHVQCIRKGTSNVDRHMQDWNQHLGKEENGSRKLCSYISARKEEEEEIEEQYIALPNIPSPLTSLTKIKGSTKQLGDRKSLQVAK